MIKATRWFQLLSAGIAMMPATVFATAFKTVPIQESGINTAYVSVPAGMHCPANLAETPTAFCADDDGRVYHMKSVNLPQPISGQQYLQSVLNDPSNADTELVAQSEQPDIANYLMRRDAPILFKQGQQITAYVLAATNRVKDEKAVMALTIANLPNNGAPVAQIFVYGVSEPLSGPNSLEQLHQEMLQFIQSYRYDPQAVQLLNARSVNFGQNLRNREQSFAQQQRQIHQSNMDALDSSFNSFMNRSQLSDQGQSNFVDSVHERRQMINPSSGLRYEVDGYGGEIYVNPSDPSQYYRSYDPTFDPNVNLNQGEYYERLEDLR